MFPKKPVQFLSQLAFAFGAFLLLTSCGKKPLPETPVDVIVGPQRSTAATKVTATYGPLVVREGSYQARASYTPWSAWWYPSKDPYLFHHPAGKLSPLEKYDLYMRKVHGKNTRAAAVEAEYYDRLGRWASDSDGLCHAWSRAAVMEPEPLDWLQLSDIHPVNINGIEFSIGDLKALLVKTYQTIEKSALESFGEPFRQDRDDDPDDIHPDQLHRLVQHQIFEKREPFFMDDDPTVETWNSPVYRATFDILPDETDPHIMHVEAALVLSKPVLNRFDSADDAHLYDFTNVLGHIGVVKFYTYDLHGYPQDNGDFNVVFGEWTGSSLWDHPDFATVTPGRTRQVEHRSLNEEIDTAVVNEILAKAAALATR